MAVVLVVEDNPANLKLAALLLQRDGHQVLQAENAERGIDIARTRQPALVLMDIQLPGMDGLEATRRLKADPATSGMKVVALTALAMAGDREKIMACGCDGYIAKPFRYADFLQQVRSYLES